MNVATIKIANFQNSTRRTVDGCQFDYNIIHRWLYQPKIWYTEVEWNSSSS